MAFSDSVDENDQNDGVDESPSGLIVKDIPQDIFTDDNVKKEFENIFICYGDVLFTYLPGFRRVIVKYTKGYDAIFAEQNLNGKDFGGCNMKVYFKEEAKKLGEEFLKLPQSEKLFLISPPASPPVGWFPKLEPIPVVNYDLLTAIAGMEMPGEIVTLVEKTDATPGIFVIGCENPEPTSDAKPLKSMKSLSRNELQTQRPPLKTVKS